MRWEYIFFTFYYTVVFEQLFILTGNLRLSSFFDETLIIGERYRRFSRDNITPEEVYRGSREKAINRERERESEKTSELLSEFLLPSLED